MNGQWRLRAPAPDDDQLRRIFAAADVVTYISEYTRVRLAPLIPDGTTMVRLASGIDTERFRPDPAARARLSPLSISRRPAWRKALNFIRGISTIRVRPQTCWPCMSLIRRQSIRMAMVR